MTLTPNQIQKHWSDLEVLGYTIIRNGTPLDLVDRVVKHIEMWTSDPNNNFEKFKQDRVCNFHRYNEDTLSLVTNSKVHDILEKMFNNKSVVYSSLMFREGTSQHFHRDTPHFYTNPINLYYGVWFALEDINVKSGPLKYVIGSHKLPDFSGHDIRKEIDAKFPDTDNFRNFQYLLHYNQKIEDLARENGLEFVDETNYDKINKGDIIIWDPRLLHGGSDILDPTLTRYSIVTHNIPQNTAVFNAKDFFAPDPTKEYIENKYIYSTIRHNGIDIIDHGDRVCVQKSYV